MKKKILSAFVLLTAILLFPGCSNSSEQGTDTPSATTITLGETVTINGQGAEADGQLVTIASGGTYILTGTLSNGQVVVDCAEQVTLRLSGVAITNAQGPAILIQQAAEAQIELADGSENILTDGADADYDAALFSCVSLTLDGSGQLTVIGNNQEGIASEENITINGGTYRITSADDGINASHDGASVITINDGYLTISADGDGIDSNGSLVINGGTIITMSALTDLSGGIDTDGDFIINGGTLLATGAVNTQPASQSTQAALSFNFKTTQAAGTLVQITADDQTLLAASPEKAYQTLLYSSDRLTADGSYSVYSGGTAETAEEILLPDDTVIADNTQQTHRAAAAAGEFIATGTLSTFDVVTYLTDTDFTTTLQQTGRPDFQGPGQRPDGEQGSTPPSGERPQKPADGGQAPEGRERPASQELPPDGQPPADNAAPAPAAE